MSTGVSHTNINTRPCPCVDWQIKSENMLGCQTIRYAAIMQIYMLFIIREMDRRSQGPMLFLFVCCLDADVKHVWR